MKFFKVRHGNIAKRSRPARGAWVEITLVKYRYHLIHCRAPQGARGLKFRETVDTIVDGQVSRPARGAWVEIKSPSIYTVAPICVAPRKGRVG